ncbi:hypothetical protein [Flavobacterium sp. YO12]|uniref:hypothetical protein n=1 Tax=Flavobacterium sp. YO12 TaxID=1920029 RepID=UPI00100BCE02|nr:hypothetical protein [Flavobacterium sp. YO12]RXM48071.1 hypothetical protein BOW55_07775 [Flavobacterium sp. YO12]
MTAEQELEVDAYVLASSGLRITSRGYKALKILFEHGNLLYWCMGKNDTLELAKILIYLKFRYNHVPGGLEVLAEHKRDFYYLVMHRKVPVHRKSKYPNTYLSVGKADRYGDGRTGWAEQILANKETEK